MTGWLHTTKNFYQYQKERFPLVVLGPSFVPAILSSGAVVGATVGPSFVALALIASLTYLLHVRIIDEFRDHAHDAVHHPERPLSLGVISLAELRIVDRVTLVAFVLTVGLANLTAAGVAALMLLYSFCARHEFFLGARLRQRFYLYNAINLVQMLLLQVLVYALADPTLPVDALIVTHFLFTATGTIVFEFLRKVKSPGEDGSGQDTYTWFLGLKNALLVYAVLAAANVWLFLRAIALLPEAPAYWQPVALAAGLGTLTTLFLHAVLRTERTNQVMQLSFMVMYGVFNILLFLAV